MRSYGHETYFDDNDIERYVDINQIVEYPSRRPCPQCHQLPTPEGHDACLGYIPGVLHACCGHGVQRGYVMWEQEAAQPVAIEIELPRWLRIILNLTGYSSYIKMAKAKEISLRYYYNPADAEGYALSTD